jgi:hypothetical protein
LNEQGDAVDQDISVSVGRGPGYQHISHRLERSAESGASRLVVGVPDALMSWPLIYWYVDDPEQRRRADTLAAGEGRRDESGWLATGP